MRFPAPKSIFAFVPAVCFGMLLGSSPTLAKSVAGKSFPATKKVGATALQLNGVGLRKATFLKVKVYAAGLYVENTSTSANDLLGKDQTFRLDLKFLRDVGKKKFDEAFREGLERNGKASELKRLTKITSALGDIEENDVLTMTYDVGSGFRMRHNGKAVGATIKQPSFAHAILATFIAKAPNKALKSGLLGG